MDKTDYIVFNLSKKKTNLNISDSATRQKWTDTSLQMSCNGMKKSNKVDFGVEN